MTEATIPVPAVGASSWMYSIRLALVALAITVVLAASFAFGRVTASSTQHTPTGHTTTAAQTIPQECRMGRPC
jgi:ABC-type arginine transport system permease subunit